MSHDQVGNPLLEPSPLPFELPDFARILPEHYLPALEIALEESRTVLAAVSAGQEPATEENVIDAWEAGERSLRRVLQVFFARYAAGRDDDLDPVQEQASIRLAGYRDSITFDPGLYERLRELEARRQAGEVALGEQAAHWLSEQLRSFDQAGAGLATSDQDRLRELNARIAELTSGIGRAIINGRNSAAILVTDEAELGGLTPAQRQAARRDADAAGHVDGWLLALDNTTCQDLLQQLTDRSLRRRIHEAAIGRGLAGDHDTRSAILEVVALRAERAELLGFENHAATVIASACARTPTPVNEMLGQLAPAAVRNARTEAADLEQELKADDPAAELTPWDWEFVAERLRAKRFHLDLAELRPYLELDRVLNDGVFAAATGLYGITFTERPDLRGWNDDVRVWEVREEDGTVIGLFLGDFYTRPGKMGGAWMNNLIDQNHLLGQAPIVTVNCNYTKPDAGDPALLGWPDVITLFHEFGHALHGLLSDTRFPSQSGAETPRDFVEFPSQVNEMWALDPGLLAQYAVHHRTGEPIPDAWVRVLRDSRQFNEGFATTEYLAAAILDQAWHQTPRGELPTEPDGLVAFEERALRTAGVQLDLVPPRYRTAYFAHIFAGGYDAGYYGYLWSEVLDADTGAWFLANGGLTRENGERFRRRLLGRGGSIDAMEAYVDFRGQQPDIRHLLARRGLTLEPATA